MRIPRLLFIVLAVALVGGALGLRTTTQSPTVSALDSTDGHGRPEPPMLGIHYARGAKPGGNVSVKSIPLLQPHGGDVMPTAQIVPIYWGGKWTDSTFAKDKITGLATFYGGVSGSAYIGTNSEYQGSSGAFAATGAITAGKAIIDTSAAPKSAPSTSAVLAEVAKTITNPVPNGYYPVYSDQPRGSAGYCAWHSWDQINGVNVQFAFFFNLDGDSGCDPQDPGNVHTPGLEALANVSGHELSEAVTDPRGVSWYDRQGAENADKCAWHFNPAGDITIGGQLWRIQGNWSNDAYNAGAGYYNRGCIDR